MTSDTTIDGSGQNITLTKKGFRLVDLKNIIFHNFTMRDCKSDRGDTGDAISIKNSENIWIHRMTISNYCDGLIDVYDGSKNITVSWSKFFDHTKAFLISQDDKTPQLDKNIAVTFHHNWMQNLDQRTPRVRFGKVDFYNNYVADWGHYAIGSTHESQILVENNIFEDTNAKKNSLIAYKLEEIPDEPDQYFVGFVSMKSNLVIPNDFTSRQNSPEKVFSRPYKANISNADNILKKTLMDFTGSSK